MKAIIDLDSIDTEFGNVSELIRDELRFFIKAELKKSFKNDKDLQRLIKEMQKKAVQKAIEEMSK